MVKRSLASSGVLKRNFGFTLIELVVVLGVMSIIATLVFYGMASFNQGQAVTLVSEEFLTNLRTMQNKVNNGADGETVKRIDLALVGGKGGSYFLQTIGDSTLAVNLPAGVTYSYDVDAYPGAVSICFSNRNLAAFDTAHVCGPSSNNPCVSGTGYICDRSTATIRSPANFQLTFTNGNFTKSILIEGTGMQINNMYGQ